VWIIFGLVLALIATILLYYHFLLSLYPEKIQTEEVHTVKTPDLWSLRVCRYRRGRIEGQPVLLVHGSVSNHHNFTSPEGACLIEHLVNKGYDCWAVDLRGCRSSIPPFERSRFETTLDQHLMSDLPSVVHYIRRVSGYNKIHWVGHSLGGMLLYAYSQVHGEEHIASGTTMGSPLGFDGVQVKIPETLLFFVRHSPRLVCAVVRALIPLGMLSKKSLPYFPANLQNIPPQMNTGHFINMLEAPLPKVQSELAFWVKNQVWRMLDDRVNIQAGLKTMTFPLLAIYAPKDPFVPLRRAAHFFQQLPHKDKKYLVCSKEEGFLHDYNHCDLAFGKNGVREVFEPIATWIKEHSTTERYIVDSDRAMAGDSTWTTPLLSEERARILSGDHFEEGGSSVTVPEATPVVYDETLATADEGGYTEKINESVLRLQQSSPQAAKQSKVKEADAKAVDDDDDDSGDTIDSEAKPVEPELDRTTKPLKKPAKKKPATIKTAHKKSTAKKKAPAKKKASSTVSKPPFETSPTATSLDETVTTQNLPEEQHSKQVSAKKAPAKKASVKKTSTARTTRSTSKSTAKPAAKGIAKKTSATRESSTASPESENSINSENSTLSEKNIELPQATRRAIAQAGDLMRAFSEPPKPKSESRSSIDSSRTEEEDNS